MVTGSATLPLQDDGVTEKLHEAQQPGFPRFGPVVKEKSARAKSSSPEKLF